MKKIKLDYSLLIYDIETAHLKARLWRPGEQFVGHKSLLHSAEITKILTISYKFYDNTNVHTLTCEADGNTDKMIAAFDEVIKKADVVIGKNNFNFDDKHINTQRMLKGNAPMPEWAYKSEDVERQMRRFFALPSYSLDYFSKILGAGGKVKMEDSDWCDIEDMLELNKLASVLLNPTKFCKHFYNKTPMQVRKDGKKALKKMVFYNQKDILDTELCLTKILPHVSLKHNAATKKKGVSSFSCITCGSNDVIPGKVVTRGMTRRHQFHCNAHSGYAGSRPFVMNAYGHKRYTQSMGK